MSELPQALQNLVAGSTQALNTTPDELKNISYSNSLGSESAPLTGIRVEGRSHGSGRPQH